MSEMFATVSRSSSDSNPKNEKARGVAGLEIRA